MRIHEITLLRHGEIQGAGKRMYYGATDYLLSEHGEAQAREAGGLLKDKRFDRVFTSTLTRAKQTLQLAQSAHALCLPCAQSDARLNEMNFGALEGKRYEDIEIDFAQIAAQIQNNWMHYQFQNGESPAQFFLRVQDFFAELATMQGRSLLVCHSGTIRAAICVLLQTDQFWRYKCDFCSLTRIEITDGYAVLCALNHTAS